MPFLPARFSRIEAENIPSGRHSRAKKAPFSGCRKFSDLMLASKKFSVVFDGHFETISEQKGAVSKLR